MRASLPFRRAIDLFLYLTMLLILLDLVLALFFIEDKYTLKPKNLTAPLSRLVKNTSWTFRRRSLLIKLSTSVAIFKAKSLGPVTPTISHLHI